MDNSIVFTFDPDLPESYEQQLDKQFQAFMVIRAAQEKVERGRDQVAKGKLRQEIVEAFLSAFPGETENIEASVKHLWNIEGETKFRAELIRMFMEMFLSGLHMAHSRPEVVTEAMKRIAKKK
jgi:hypothetical protein